MEDNLGGKGIEKYGIFFNELGYFYIRPQYKFDVGVISLQTRGSWISFVEIIHRPILLSTRLMRSTEGLIFDSLRPLW